MEAVRPVPESPDECGLDGDDVLSLVVRELCARGLLALNPASTGTVADDRA
ncbi:hypothetical protein ACFW3D_32680 [Streptomyces sp. NPDC058864]